MRFFVALCIGWLLSASVFADKYFLADGATFATLEARGRATPYQLSYSSGGEPALDQGNLGVFSLADGDTLYLTGFENNTVESGGSAIFTGSFAHRVHAVGQTPGIFATNFSTILSTGITRPSPARTIIIRGWMWRSCRTETFTITGRPPTRR